MGVGVAAHTRFTVNGIHEKPTKGNNPAKTDLRKKFLHFLHNYTSWSIMCASLVPIHP